jgi:hypothetical protein
MKIVAGFPLLIASVALLVAPVVFRPGDQSAANAHAKNMGSGELVGRVVNTAGKLNRHLQVRANGIEWTINVPDNAPVMNGHRSVSVHDINLGTYVRAIGTRIGATRLKANRLYVVGDRLAVVRAGYPRNGYFSAYAGYRSRYHYRHRR